MSIEIFTGLLSSIFPADVIELEYDAEQFNEKKKDLSDQVVEELANLINLLVQDHIIWNGLSIISQAKYLTEIGKQLNGVHPLNALEAFAKNSINVNLQEKGTNKTKNTVITEDQAITRLSEIADNKVKEFGYTFDNAMKDALKENQELAKLIK